MIVPTDPAGQTMRVGGFILVSGDEIPPEFEALAPEAWKQTGTKQPKIKAGTAVESGESVEDIR